MVAGHNCKKSGSIEASYQKNAGKSSEILLLMRNSLRKTCEKVSLILPRPCRDYALFQRFQEFNSDELQLATIMFLPSDARRVGRSRRRHAQRGGGCR